MRHLIFIAVFMFATLSFAQGTGVIVGKVLDKELNDDPLVFANVSVKETSSEVVTDMTGLFVIEHLEAGDYTLIFSFAGYESQEMKVSLKPLVPVDIKVSLAASSISLEELALLTGLVQEDIK